MEKKPNNNTKHGKDTVHFVDSQLLNPTNPVTVNLVGVGGTGSSMLTALARIDRSLIALGHPGLQVTAYDPDIVEEPNLGRQLFTDAELGMNKAVALINKVNRAMGTQWKAHVTEFLPESETATITVSCVDNVASRLKIAEILSGKASKEYMYYSYPVYWMDCGNEVDTGQVILSTTREFKQPKSRKFRTQGHLPMITEEFGKLLDESEKSSNTPSCSLAEALERQDLFINTNIANIGASLIWNMFRKGLLRNRGFFVNLSDFRMQPIRIKAG